MSVLQHNVQEYLRDQNNSLCTTFPARKSSEKTYYLTLSLSFSEYTGWYLDKSICGKLSWLDNSLPVVLVSQLSHIWLFATPWTATRQGFPSITNSRSLLKLMSIKSVMPYNHLILCCPLLLLPLIFPSIIVFSNESVLCIGWPKYWSFSFSIILSREHPGLISFRMDWLDLLAVQGTLKSFLQHYISKVSVLQHLA